MNNSLIEIGVPILVGGFFAFAGWGWPHMSKIRQFIFRTLSVWSLMAIPILVFFDWIWEHKLAIGYIALPFIIVAVVFFWEKIITLLQPVIEDDLKALRTGVGRRIYYSNFYLNCQWIGLPVPYLEISMSILNAASFPIAIEGFDDGLMIIEDVNCKDTIELKEKEKVILVEHAANRNITIKQWISKEQADIIRKLGQQNNNHGNIRIFLNNCKLIIRPQIPGKESESMNVTIGETLSLTCNGI